jgi:hypothetical protein
MVKLGPFKPEVVLYGFRIDPTIELMLDVVTSRTGARVKADARGFIDSATLQEKLSRIAQQRLPFAVHANPCTLVIDKLEFLEFQVVGYTGDVRITLSRKIVR